MMAKAKTSIPKSVHPGVVLHSMIIAKAAEDFKVHADYLFRIIDGECNLDEETIANISEFTGTDEGFWEGLQYLNRHSGDI